MAIYDVNAIMESEQPEGIVDEGYVDEEALEEEAEAVLDNMLEACDYMLTTLEESTAAQRHYGTTSKELSKYTDFVPNPYNSKNVVGKMALKSTAKQIAKGDKVYDKAFERGKKAYDKMHKNDGPGDYKMSDREWDESKVQQKAALKGSIGANMAKAAKAGYDVKGEIDKAKAKAAKKKAIKETCLSILSVIDEL